MSTDETRAPGAQGQEDTSIRNSPAYDTKFTYFIFSGVDIESAPSDKREGHLTGVFRSRGCSGIVAGGAEDTGRWAGGIFRN
jgi:hypothetical protein